MKHVKLFEQFVNEGKYKLNQEVKYIVPGTSDEMETGKITGFKDTRDEQFAIIDGKNVPFKNISEQFVNEAKDKVDVASLSIGNTYKDNKGYPVKVIDIKGTGSRWKITYQYEDGKKKTVSTSLDKGINLYESEVNEASISHAEVIKLEKHLSPKNKKALTQAIKDGIIKTSKDLSDWAKSIEESVNAAGLPSHDAFKSHKKDIEDALYKGSGHRYWKLEVLPEWDNIIGGYNLQATATGVTGRNTVLESTNDIKRTIREVKALPFVSKAMVSRRYNKKMMTVIAIGLK